MELVLIPKFKDFFIDDECTTLEELLVNIPSSIVISSLAWINAELHPDPLNYKGHLKILRAFIERSPKHQIDSICDNLEYFSNSNPDKQISLFPLVVSLNFLEYEILNYRPGDFHQLSPVDELNIFKAFLICSRDLDENHEKELRYVAKMKNWTYPNEFFYRASWPFIFAQFEHTQSNNMLIQAYLSFDFLKYLREDDMYSEYVERYLNKLKIEGTHSYVFKILELYINSYKAGGGKFIARFSPDILEMNPLLKQFVLNPLEISLDEYKSYKKNVDFKGIREKPIIQHQDGFISISNWKYVIDKLFQAFVFDFFHNSGIKAKVSFNDYKSDVGNDFAQKEIFERVMDSVFSNTNGIRLKDEGELINFDYYYRNGNKIVLIEFKDILLKFNSAYESIKEDIDNKLIEEKHKGKVSKKGISQLIDSIIKISKRYQDVDDFEEDGFTKNSIIIYPVIVYTHKALGMPGINDYLGERFAAKIKSHHGFFMIRDLVMVDFEVFLNCFDALREGEIQFIDLIENYLSRLSILNAARKWQDTSLNRMKMFSTFEESISKTIYNRCGFYNSSLYKELENRIFPKNK